MTAVAAPVQRARLALIALGCVLVAVALVVFVLGVPIGQWGGVLVWLVAAVVLHDGVFAPLVLVGNRLLRRVGARTSWRAVAVVQIALVIGGALTAVAFPGIRAQQLGARNPSVLVFPYALHLAVAWAVLGVLAAAVVVLLGLRGRRRG